VPAVTRALPAEPLLEFVRLRGGLSMVLAVAGIEPWDDETGQMTQEHARYRRTLQNGRARGWFQTQWTDRFACELLKVPPESVYGETWYEPIDVKILEGSE